MIICPRCNDYCKGKCKPRNVHRRFFLGMLGGLTTTALFGNFKTPAQRLEEQIAAARAVQDKFFQDLVLQAGGRLNVEYTGSNNVLPILTLVEMEKVSNKEPLQLLVQNDEFLDTEDSAVYYASEAMLITNVRCISVFDRIVREIPVSSILRLNKA